jgi:hypothetical protein
MHPIVRKAEELVFNSKNVWNSVVCIFDPHFPPDSGGTATDEHSLLRVVQG